MAEIVRVFNINATSQQELDDRIENLILYGRLLALVKQYGIIAVVEAFEQVSRTMQDDDADDR